MIIEKTHIHDVKLIKPKVYNDSRGYFFESFNQKLSKNLNCKFIQSNESFSKYGVLRGIHFQKSPYQQAKLVRVIKGEIQDIAIDLRPTSKTYKKYVSVKLSDVNKNQIFIPKGFGHAFLTISKEAIVSYMVDSIYNQEYESGIRYDDKSICINWDIDDKKIILSDKDKNLPFL
tara:strand:+ start:695 stop:1216 length:522 start_codon:yes stop_codon:yes gene_type:complete